MAHLQREEAKKYMLEGISKRYLRIEEIADLWDMEQEVCMTYLRAAGAVYKFNGGGTVLVNLDLFDEYMEQFRINAIPMKHPLYAGRSGQ